MHSISNKRMGDDIDIAHGVFDCHLHAEDGFKDYDAALQGGNIIFNSVESYRELSGLYPGFHHSLIFDIKESIDFYRQLVDDQKIAAFKIHSRLQQISEDQYPDLIKALEKIDRDVPVIYDAFYYGPELAYQPSLSGLIMMINAFPGRRFAIAHAGGYEILKYFFHLREYNNVGYDLSFSLQYLADSSCRADMVKLIKYTPPGRLFFGSDYPHGSAARQLTMLCSIADDLQFGKQALEGILQNNWKKFIGVE